MRRYAVLPDWLDRRRGYMRARDELAMVSRRMEGRLWRRRRGAGCWYARRHRLLCPSRPLNNSRVLWSPDGGMNNGRNLARSIWRNEDLLRQWPARLGLEWHLACVR